MHVIIRKPVTRAKVEKAAKKLRKDTAKPKRKFSAYKHLGKVKLNIDPVEYQKQLRDEWE